MRTRDLGCVHNLIVTGIQPSITDVVPDAAREEMRRLKYDADAAVDRSELVVQIVMPVDSNGPFGGLIETTEQIHNGRFAAAGWADKSDHFTRLNLQREVREDRFAILIIEVHMFELDLAHQCLRFDGIRAVMDLGRSINQLEDSLSRRNGMLHLRVDTRELLDRPHHKREI